MLTLHLMLCCPVCSHLSLARTPAILSTVTWEDGSKFLQLPSPLSHRRNPGPPLSLMSESGSWGGVPTSSISGSCCFPTLQPYLHSSAPQLWNSEFPRLALTSPKLSIIHRSARPTGGTPSTGAGPQCHMLCILHIQPFPLNSAKSTMKKVKASFFVCVFIRSPLFFQPPIFLLGPSP